MSVELLAKRAAQAAKPQVIGTVAAVVGLTVSVEGISAAIGDLLTLKSPVQDVRAEVVSASGGRLTCLPLGPIFGIGPGVEVRTTGGPLEISVGSSLLGRVLDGLGEPIDGLGPLYGAHRVSVENSAPAALTRQRVNRQLGVGVRALDVLVPVGRGQRLGLFAGSGVGKSTLLSMIARGTEAQVAVIALVGERGREVREFIENDLGAAGLARSVIVVATSDQPPVVRLRSAFVATRIAEWFRDEGADVVLMMDSVTRVATAQREIGLSAGEPPATRGFPPSVFALLPRLLERAGCGERGSITGIYTVLVEGDDINDPIGDTVRSILDGHVVLDRRLATSGHYPSIDVLDSVSRVAPAVTNSEQRTAATIIRRLLSAHREAKVLLEIGAYVPGTNSDVDRARELMPMIDGFLRQEVDHQSTLSEAWDQVFGLTGVDPNRGVK
ncbi:MAG TPA: FliI/YscN family ATPase [Candidatus Nanopelagicaceae bacterium]|nr:FliI/YscN family ATPase [Candidatus Nanopelagicaceae bacterium]